MTNLQSKLTALSQELQSFLQAKARNLSYPASSLFFKVTYGSSLILTDKANQEFYVDETYLSSFRDIYTNRAYKFLRLDEWEIQIIFEGRYCRKIDIVCTAATFLATKIESRHISGCCIKFTIILNPRDFGKLSPKSLGYLRRISKKNICQQSSNITGQMNSLIGFVPLKRMPNQYFDYRPWRQAQQQINPLQTLSPLGVEALKKLSHFITKQQIHDFVINNEVSREASEELQKLIANRKAKKQEQS